MCLLLAWHFLLAFCAIDFLHTREWHNVKGVPVGADDGCPACQFKRSANAEQPEFVAALAPFVCQEQPVALPVQTVEYREPPCRLFLRAPPA